MYMIELTEEERHVLFEIVCELNSPVESDLHDPYDEYYFTTLDSIQDKLS